MGDGGGGRDVEEEGDRRGSWVWEGVEGRPALVIALKSSTFAVRFAPANRLIKLQWAEFRPLSLSADETDRGGVGVGSGEGYEGRGGGAGGAGRGWHSLVLQVN